MRCPGPRLLRGARGLRALPGVLILVAAFGFGCTSDDEPVATATPPAATAAPVHAALLIQNPIPLLPARADMPAGQWEVEEHRLTRGELPIFTDGMQGAWEPCRSPGFEPSGASVPAAREGVARTFQSFADEALFILTVGVVRWESEADAEAWARWYEQQHGDDPLWSQDFLECTFSAGLIATAGPSGPVPEVHGVEGARSSPRAGAWRTTLAGSIRGPDGLTIVDIESIATRVANVAIVVQMMSAGSGAAGPRHVEPLEVLALVEQRAATAPR